MAPNRASTASSIMSRNAGDTERIDGTGGLERLALEIHPMSGCGLRKGVGVPDMAGTRIEADEIAQL